MTDRKIPVNWTINKEIWEAIQKIVKVRSEQAGVKVSTSAIVNQLLEKGIAQEQQNGNQN